MNIVNALSWSRVVFSVLIIFGYVLTLSLPQFRIVIYQVITLFFVVGSFTDFLDGYISKKYNLTTNLGKLIDPITDKILVNTTLIVITIIFANQIPIKFFHFFLPIVTIIMIIRDSVVDFFRMLALKQGMVVGANLFGKIKTIFQLFALDFLLIYTWLPLTTVKYTGILLLTLAFIFSIISGYIYIKILHQKLKL